MVAACGGIEAVVAAMKQHLSVDNVQEFGCGVLRALAADYARNAKMVAAGGGIEAVVAAMKQRLSDANVQEHGCAALWNLALGNAENAKMVAACGGIKVVVAAMKQHLSVDNVQEFGCGALGNIAANNSANVKAIAACGGSAVVRNALKQHPTITTDLATNVINTKECLAPEGIVAVLTAIVSTTWVGVQLWRWWLPPSAFRVRGGGGGGGDDDRVVCTSRTTTIWAVMLSAYKSSEVLDVLPDLEPELWEHIFTFLKHEQQPTFPLSLEEQGYFHGKISRSEVNPLLKRVGDYLVRESTKKPGELMLSVKTSGEKVMHFIIQQDVPGKFRFEGEAKDSVDDLINYYKSTDLSVTKRSEAKLKAAVNRHGFNDVGDGDMFALSHRDVKIGKKLGNGNFGEVKRGTIVATGLACAVKTCKDTVPDLGWFLEEADTLKDYDHPNIVRLIGVVSTKPFYLILELCKDELLAYIQKHGNLLEVGTFVRMSSEAAEGMNYLHSKNYIHRDLAARNCLIGNDGAVKISDFAMSRMTEGDDEIYTVNTTAKRIPIKWTAPEALTHMTYVLATDVWAFGILVWEIFSCGKMPYPGMNPSEIKEEVINQGYRMNAPAGTPDEVQQLMDECWQHNLEERPSMADIVDLFEELTASYPDEATSM